ncbi:MAG: zinc ribbon domain-containing protein, partial [Coriobacteriaceae bacterium]|nr:zinc ribbon domain-containing protein [Coriobacteriaceae bacterium]
MICPHCGRYLEDGVAFCIYCGQRLGKYASGDAAEPSQAVNLGDASADAFEVEEPREAADAP